MYKLLLCWRYLRTRYLALVCIVSVMLGVATLIVVNSVMAGFSTKLKERLHGLLSDVVLEGRATYDGFSNPQQIMAHIRKDPVLNDKIEAMTATLEIFAMMQYGSPGQSGTRPIRLIAVDPETRAKVGGFAEFLVSKRNQKNPSMAFELDEEGRRHYEFMNPPMPIAWHDPAPALRPRSVPDEAALPLPPGLPVPQGPDRPVPAEPMPSRPHTPSGSVVGFAIAHYRIPKADAPHQFENECVMRPGDTFVITTVSGAKMVPVYDRLVVTDYVKTEMSEYDSNYVYVPLEFLQKLRAMPDRVTSLQIKLKDYADARLVVNRMESMFDRREFVVQTWEDKQGPLLAAIRVEKGILNVLLFLIIAVAGFGILAIFSMIVVEKTRDIGILKALGASNVGVMKIFLTYGLLLGLVGAGLGTVMGLTITHRINDIEEVISHLTGQEIFPRDVYYFNEIPTDIQPTTVLLVNLGAVAIAVLFSVLPALRAASLHPVRALRFE